MAPIKAAVAASTVILGVAACSSSAGNTHGSSAVPTAPRATTTRATTASPPTPASSTSVSARVATAALSGTWDGHYSGGYSGRFTLTWTESGSSLNGTIRLSSPSASLPIHGTLSSGHISFGTVGSTQITYTGSVSGATMTGRYLFAGGAGGTGNWDASKA